MLNITQKDNLKNFYWIGGCPSGGKTTISGEISDIKNFIVYHTDDHGGEFNSSLNPEEQPNMYKMMNTNFDELIMLPDDLWLNTTIAGMRELFPIILKKINELSTENDVIIEGTELLPELLSNIGVENQSICVNPTYEYLHEFLPQQAWVQRILLCLRDEEYKSLFLKKLIVKYNLYREYLIESAKKYNIKTIITSSPSSLENNMKMISQYFLKK